MSVDLEHKLIYELCVEPVIVFGDKVIGKKAVRIYQEEDGTYLITEHTEASDLDPRDCHSIKITKQMLVAMMSTRPERILV